MIEKEVITLEDGIEYILIDEIENYLYLANEKNENDFCIRKNIKENGEDFIVGLDDEAEFDKALELYKKSYE